MAGKKAAPQSPEELVALGVEGGEEKRPLPPESAEEMEGVEEGNAVETLLEELSQGIMAADLNDLSGLGALDAALESLAGQLREEEPLGAGLARALSVLVERIILDEAGDAEKALELVAGGIDQLQRLRLAFVRYGREAAADPELLDEIARLAGVEAAGAAAQRPPEEEGGQPAPESDPEVDAEIFADFLSEAEEHFGVAESTLLQLERQPGEPELLNTVFRAFHTVKGAAGFLNLREVTRVAHAVEDLFDAARRGELRITSGLLDVVLESIDVLKLLLKNVEAQLEGGEAVAVDLEAFLAKLAAGGAPAAEAAPAAASPASLGAPAAAGRRDGKPREQHFVRVGTEKLDRLVNMVGELVITQTQVAQNPAILSSRNQKLNKDIAQLSKVSNDIQEVAMSMRMVPIRGTFERMARMVRDLARKCGKEVEFRMVGEDTELDKNVVEELVDPLTHMVRNAVDHGIEAPEERRQRDKPPRGRVQLEAYHRGGSIVIELSDDGRGLDRERIEAKAVERGLVGEGEELGEREVYELIFRPGFSTVEEISDISGRGVGMDVVRRSIENLRGKAEVDSTPGRGSVFSIRLPLTLAIIDGMVVGVGAQRYILPLTSIVRSLRPLAEEVFRVMDKGEMVKVQEEVFPLVRLHQRFGVRPRCAEPSEGLVVLLEAEGGRYGLLVDELIGMQQVVIKALEEDLRGERCLSGCAILGDGQVGLILDPNGLGAGLKNGSKGKAKREMAVAAA